MKPEERAEKIAQTLEWNAGVVLAKPAIRYLADAIAAAEREAFEAGVLAAYESEKRPTYDDWQEERDDEGG